MTRAGNGEETSQEDVTEIRNLLPGNWEWQAKWLGPGHGDQEGVRKSVWLWWSQDARFLWSVCWQQASVTLIIKYMLCLLPTAAGGTPSIAAACYKQEWSRRVRHAIRYDFCVFRV